MKFETAREGGFSEPEGLVVPVYQIRFPRQYW